MKHAITSTALLFALFSLPLVTRADAVKAPSVQQQQYENGINSQKQLQQRMQQNQQLHKQQLNQQLQQRNTQLQQQQKQQLQQDKQRGTQQRMLPRQTP
ncbi:MULTISPECIES: hypothetical protein [Brenneria]|uniref:DUF2756 domain-containing protein n=1 Tax=Brenneria nigrifluens DSM 30175 = ATCC 13028 TaxID=1121120 RepID=A0A2U1UQC3_9GAMM|nr:MULTISPECIES: hypothetical protein [Brenneria]EHD23610.1 hypothetical protein BrE312_4291 [Brenneria sp. EniD312]PWC23866.1 hypothetical protein DDT54_12070 [Brenneria nigrifluens DSM 30175 = ATCC 13028]QCR06537.1 hypothetical protein EH206_21715 [Brenneria nigrifluens DSM 30175 = ATCC 13028]